MRLPWTRTLGVEELVSFHTFPGLPFHLHSNPGSLTALVQQSESENDMCASWLLKRLGLRELKPKHPHRSQNDSLDPNCAAVLKANPWKPFRRVIMFVSLKVRMDAEVHTLMESLVVATVATVQHTARALLQNQVFHFGDLTEMWRNDFFIFSWPDPSVSAAMQGSGVRASQSPSVTVKAFADLSATSSQPSHTHTHMLAVKIGVSHGITNP